MILTAIGPGGRRGCDAECRGCDAACSIWDPDFRRRATQPDEDDKLLALLSRRDTGAPCALTLAAAEEALRAVRRSTSWRLTAPVRGLGRAVHRSRRGA